MGRGAPVPGLVTLDLWRVPPRRVPAALARMATDRVRLGRRGSAAPVFAKMLGTGDGRTFTVRDATPTRWALLACWRDERDAAAFERSAVIRGWGRLCDERWRIDLRPTASRGRWSRRAPFGDPPAARQDGPVAAITRARLAPAKALTFWRAVPPVSADLHRSPGLRLAVGIGEAPLGLQGTFSLWSSAADLRAFAYARPAHMEAVRRTAEEHWYAEELFARFAVVGARGTVDGRDPLAVLRVPA